MNATSMNAWSLVNFVDSEGEICEGRILADVGPLCSILYHGIWNYEWVSKVHIFPYESLIPAWRDSLKKGDLLSVQKQIGYWCPAKVIDIFPEHDEISVQMIPTLYPSSPIRLHWYRDIEKFAKLGNGMTGLSSYQCHVLCEASTSLPILFQGIVGHQALEWFVSMTLSDILETGPHGWTSLMMCAYHNRMDIFQWIVSHVEIDDPSIWSFVIAQNDLQENAFMIAFQHSHFAFVNCLLQTFHNFPVDVQDCRGRTVFHYKLKCQACPAAVFRRVLQNYDRPNQRDDTGKTPLHHLVQSLVPTSLLRDLIQKGEDPCAKHPTGKTMIDFFYMSPWSLRRREETFQLLDIYQKLDWIQNFRKASFHSSFPFSPLGKGMMELSDDLFQEWKSYLI